jgi:hypothetical protein|tara:strand:+ start:443 stop:853 length:411 start_codon:yes stop_codon:yes gene_type:complete
MSTNTPPKPGILKSGIMFIVDSWRGIMDVRYNPLKFIQEPVLQTYFMLVLFMIWSASFGLIAIYHLGWLGYSIVTSIVIHLSVLIPIVITNAVFIDAERDGANWLKEWRTEQSRYKIFVNRLKMKNIVRWNLDNEA